MWPWHFSWDFFKLGPVPPENALNDTAKSSHSNLTAERPQSRERKIGCRSRRSEAEHHPGQGWAVPPGRGTQPRKQRALVVLTLGVLEQACLCSKTCPSTCRLCDLRLISPALWSSTSYLLSGKKLVPLPGIIVTVRSSQNKAWCRRCPGVSGSLGGNNSSNTYYTCFPNVLENQNYMM